MSLDPAVDISGPFNAKYSGTCALDTCERKQVIEIGDVIQFVCDHVMHMVCARRVAREQTAPLCGTCWRYHRGECA